LNVYYGIEEIYVCNKCEKSLVKTKCENCGREFYFSIVNYEKEARLRDMVRLGLCYECFRAYRRRIRREIFDNELQPSLPFSPIDELLI